jgi:hypothetical protein
VRQEEELPEGLALLEEAVRGLEEEEGEATEKLKQVHKFSKVSGLVG